MSLSTSFFNALSGMTVNTKMTEIASNNLANALTDGYGRQSVNLGSAALGGRGIGVAERSITRASALQYTESRRQADGEAANGSVQAEALARLGTQLGEATAEDGLFRRIEALETGLRQLSETPSSAPLQSQVVDAARDLADKFSSISDQALTVRSDADAAIARDVATVNRNLQDIESLNAKIQALSITDTSVPSLIDQRERLIDEVNAIIPVRIQPQDNNVVHLYTAGGQFILQERAQTLEFSRTPVITTPMIYDPAGGGALSGLTLRGQDITPGSNNSLQVREGTLAGHFAVRDQITVEHLERVDQFTANMISRFEDPAVDPTITAGDPGLFTDNGAALDLLNIEGLAGRISVNALVDPAEGGDPARLRDGLQSVGPGPLNSDAIPRNLLDALSEQVPASGVPGLAGSLSAFQTISGIVELVGIQRTDAEAEAARLSITRETLATSEADQIGVDTDQELQSLIQIEQAFAANVQVVQTASRMLQELLEIR
ncbi:MAG: flagellar hook-associated protein FlgK [Pseudomonadota bacterium]